MANNEKRKWITVRVGDREVKIEIKSLDEVLQVDVKEDEDNQYQSET